MCIRHTIFGLVEPAARTSSIPQFIPEIATLPEREQYKRGLAYCKAAGVRYCATLYTSVQVSVGNNLFYSMQCDVTLYHSVLLLWQHATSSSSKARNPHTYLSTQHVLDGALSCRPMMYGGASLERPV